MKTDPALRNLQTAQYHAMRALTKKYPETYNLFKQMYKPITRDYTNKAMRCLRVEHEREFQEFYEVEALKRGIKTNYHRRKLTVEKIRLQLDPTKPLKVRLI